MGNPDNSTDISGSDPARRTALAEATNVLEAPWLKPSSARRLAKMPMGPMSRLPRIYDPGRAGLRINADVLGLRQAHRKDRRDLLDLLSAF